ncbi:MAG: transcriptional repressor [Oscillospiraceae bacterium]|nr:transcriptional repressor [Oscillospiraceae bacterium]
MDRNNYNTKQRDEIVDFFTKRRGKCFSAKDIIKSGEITSGEATVYRTLSKLTESGVLKRFTDGNSSCYQLADSNECASHFHLRCDKCGKLIHLDCDFINEVQNHIKAKHDFFVDIGKTVFYGLCGECAKGESNA